MLNCVIDIGLYWYYYNNMDESSFFRKVAILAIKNFIIQEIENQGMHLFNFIMSIIWAMVNVKIMDFLKARGVSIGWAIFAIIICDIIILFIVGMMMMMLMVKSLF